MKKQGLRKAKSKLKEKEKLVAGAKLLLVLSDLNPLKHLFSQTYSCAEIDRKSYFGNKTHY